MTIASCAQDLKNEDTMDKKENYTEDLKVKDGKKNAYNELTEFEEYVILNKGTERPGTGEYTDHKERGTYLCKRCNAPLYHSQDKFDSH